MRKGIITLIVALFAATGVVLASPAQAALGGSGSCDYGPGVAHVYVHEYPAEGDLSYVTLDSSHAANLSLSTDKPYYNGGNTLLTTGHFFSDPIDGDGWWNYQDNWNWDATSTYSTITKVVVYFQQSGSSNHCSVTVYI